MSNFEPRKVKFRKCHKGHKGLIPGISTAREFSSLQGGNAIVHMMSNIRISSKHFAVMRLLCSKILKSERKGSFKLPIFPNRSLTKKAAETRMGSGKGAPEMFVAMVKAGDVLIEFFDVPEAIVRTIFSQVICKIPGKLSLLFTGEHSGQQ